MRPTARAMPEDSGTNSGSLLSTWTEHDHDTVRLELRGELSARTIGALERHLELLWGCAERLVVVDLSRLSHIDPTGARVLVGLSHYVRGGGGTCSFTGATRPVRRLLAEAAAAIDGTSDGKPQIPVLPVPDPPSVHPIAPTG